MQVSQAVPFVMGALILLLLLILVVLDLVFIRRLHKNFKRICHEFGNCVNMKTRLEWNQRKTVLCNDGKRRSINYVNEVLNERI